MPILAIILCTNLGNLKVMDTDTLKCRSEDKFFFLNLRLYLFESTQTSSIT